MVVELDLFQPNFLAGFSLVIYAKSWVEMDHLGLQISKSVKASTQPSSADTERMRRDGGIIYKDA